MISIAAGRRQVWGTTFAIDDSRSGRALRTLPAEFDALVERLNAGINQRLRDERDPRRRSAAVRVSAAVRGAEDAIAGARRWRIRGSEQDRRLFLRGVYLTSGTQEGTPIDRLLGSLGRAAGLGTDGRAAAPEAGRAYFIEQLLRDVVLQEAGLAGTDRRAELQKAALQLAAYAGLALLAVLGVVALAVSFGKNRAYLKDVGQAVDALADTPPEARAGTVAAAAAAARRR